jgi:hypothetical protein
MIVDHNIVYMLIFFFFLKLQNGIFKFFKKEPHVARATFMVFEYIIPTYWFIRPTRLQKKFPMV